MLIRGLQNLESPFGKDLILLVGSCCLGELNRGLENLEAPERKTDWYFLRRAKSTAKTRRGLRPSGLRGRFKALPKKILAKFSGGTSRNRFFAQNGGEKALNRCEVPALQRKDLERTTKEQPCSLQTVGYGWVRICSVGCENGWLLQKVKRFVRMGDVQFAEKAYFCGL